jgi:hypothetical protein
LSGWVRFFPAEADVEGGVCRDLHKTLNVELDYPALRLPSFALQAFAGCLRDAGAGRNARAGRIAARLEALGGGRWSGSAPDHCQRRKSEDPPSTKTLFQFVHDIPLQFILVKRATLPPIEKHVITEKRCHAQL